MSDKRHQKPYRLLCGRFYLSHFFIFGGIMTQPTFIENTINYAKQGAEYYKVFFLEKDYLIYSRDFKNQDYYIVVAQEKNFLHLTGMSLKNKYDAKKFVKKLINDEIEESDIDPPSSFKRGAIRDKRSILSELKNFWSQQLEVEEDFTHNKVTCKLASTNGKCTLGFIDNGSLRPSTLLKGKLTSDKKVPVHCILSRPRNAKLFDKIEYGEISAIEQQTLEEIENKLDLYKLR